jgi:hypothetical protein
VGIAGLVDCSDPDETGGLERDPDHYAGPGTAAGGTPFGVEELAEDDYGGDCDRCCGCVSDCCAGGLFGGFDYLRTRSDDRARARTEKCNERYVPMVPP